MTKTFKQKLIAVALGLVLAVFTSYVSAMSRPSTINSNPDTFIGIGPSIGSPDWQVKDGVLNAIGLLVGNYSSGAYTTINSLGKMSIGASVTGSALSINNSNTIFNNSLYGSIRSTALAWNDAGTVASHLVCADPNGKLILCSNNGTREFGLGGAGDQTIYDSFIVPPGVSSITVQVIGGGGAGYGSANLEGTGIDDGDESYFIGNGVSLIATGGRGAYGSFDSGILYVGSKGTGSYSGSVSSATALDGENGIASSQNASLNAYSTHGSAPINCGGTPYYPVIGGLGDVGGNGGKAGNGSQAQGGASGPHGPLSSQDYPPIYNTSAWTFLNANACSLFMNKTSDMIGSTYIPDSVAYHRPGGNGSNGVKGGGGAGFGGRGGASAFLVNANGCDTLANANDPDFNCDGKVAAPGGGGGGYAQATITVTPGQVFYLKMGRGGVPQNNNCSVTDCELKQPGGGAISGKGGDGYIKITY